MKATHSTKHMTQYTSLRTRGFYQPMYKTIDSQFPFQYTMVSTFIQLTKSPQVWESPLLYNTQQWPRELLPKMYCAAGI